MKCVSVLPSFFSSVVIYWLIPGSALDSWGLASGWVHFQVKYEGVKNCLPHTRLRVKLFFWHFLCLTDRTGGLYMAFTFENLLSCIRRLWFDPPWEKQSCMTFLFPPQGGQRSGSASRWYGFSILLKDTSVRQMLSVTGAWTWAIHLKDIFSNQRQHLLLHAALRVKAWTKWHFVHITTLSKTSNKARSINTRETFNIPLSVWAEVCTEVWGEVNCCDDGRMKHLNNGGIDSDHTFTLVYDPQTVKRIDFGGL